MILRKIFIYVGFVMLLGCGGQGADQPAADVNPFFVAYDTPFDVQPFDRIDEAHFVPAFEKGMEDQNAEIAAIIDNPEAPTFDNTIAALDRSGELLEEVSRVFFALSGSNTNDGLQEIQQEISPRLAAHRDEIQLNPGLFARVKAVYDERETLGLDDEQLFLLEHLYTRACPRRRPAE